MSGETTEHTFNFKLSNGFWDFLLITLSVMYAVPGVTLMILGFLIGFSWPFWLAALWMLGVI